MRIPINLIFLLILVVGGILLQIFLSKRKNKWLGLILPLLCLLFSIIPVLNVPMTGSAVFQVIIVLLLYNIPTAILLIVYFACRESIKKNSQLEKMNIQDLE